MKSVLIVEDEIIISFSLKMMLASKGYSVIGQTRTGKDAISAYISHQPDIVLMDINLKGDMTGIDTVKEILKVGNPKIIFISAYKKEEIIKDSFLNKFEYIKKPLDEEDLFDKL